MITVHVRLKDCCYPIAIGRGIVTKLPAMVSSFKLGRDAVIITDRSVAKLHGATVQGALKNKGYSVKTFAVPAGEQSKSAAVAMKLIEDIAKYDVDKNIFIVALGGGVVGDLAGFVAAIYKRGVPYIQVPTTLLAQIDSAIGGKVAIDLTVAKNLAGAFYQPKLVLSDVDFLTTLDARQIRNGLAEAVKYGVILEAKLFDYLESNYNKFLSLEPSVLTKVVADCSRLKADVVSKDEKETKGFRLILNFGHTLGHAVENAGNYRYHHGESVALGMRMAAYLSTSRGMLSLDDNRRLNALLSGIGLPEVVEGIAPKKILAAMRHDKKFIAGENRFILAEKIGKVSVIRGIPLEQIQEALDAYSV